MKDYYLYFLILFVVVAICVVSYKSGYSDGYKLGSSMCHVIYPQDQNAQVTPAPQNTPQKGVK